MITFFIVDGYICSKTLELDASALPVATLCVEEKNFWGKEANISPRGFRTLPITVSDHSLCSPDFGGEAYGNSHVHKLRWEGREN